MYDIKTVMEFWIQFIFLTPLENDFALFEA